MINKRIKSLIPKPWTFPYPDREMYSREQMESLAEQLVGECIIIVRKNHASPDGVQAIMKHFGIES